MSEDAYPHVFTPIRLGPVEVANRIYMAPHGIPLAVAAEGHGPSHLEPSRDRVFYFAERAAGGVGLIFHSMHVNTFAAQIHLAESPGLAASIPAYRAVADGVHEHGGKLIAQVWYVAWQPHRWERLGPEAPAFAPSPTQQFAQPGTRHELSRRTIGRIVEGYGQCAANLRAAGYDGVEVHVSHGSLVEYFLSPYFNHRTDEYGGDLDGRMRLLDEILAVTRDAAGDGMAVGIRINAEEMLPGGLDAAATREVLERLARAEVLDFVDVDISVEPEQRHLMTTSFFEPTLHNVDRVAAVRSAAAPVPVLATPGRVTSLAQAERLLADGTVDMVGAVRGLIAEPELVKKAREGREAESRVCVAVNACADPLSVGWGCAINAAAGKEEHFGVRTLTPAPRALRVVVVGGGPAGLEAARVAAVRGHRVTLVEAEQRLGGGVARWAALPGREAMAGVAGWFETQLPQVGVELRLGERATADSVAAESPDVVVVATGSRYSRTGASGAWPFPVDGWDGPSVVPLEAVIDGSARPAGDVVVVDDEGYHAAAGVAELLAAAGARVRLVARRGGPGASTGLAVRYIVERLRRAGVTVDPVARVTAIREGTATVLSLSTGETQEVPADAVVFATMRDPVDELAHGLEGRVPYVYVIGDALAPRSLREATYEGHRFARVIGEPEMPETVLDALFDPQPGALSARDLAR